ncbi:hypothetical protein [Stutzerimonas tarimensis]|uniref:Lipoprotein n=1 Tax=Stutzerimonas tarimensis TaxID=1507735 RepID=A0ABV7T3A0_9GAMM
MPQAIHAVAAAALSITLLTGCASTKPSLGHGLVAGSAPVVMPPEENSEDGTLRMETQRVVKSPKDFKDYLVIVTDFCEQTGDGPIKPIDRQFSGLLALAYSFHTIKNCSL